MKLLLLLTVAFELANCLPIPAGQIVKYRVPNKFFASKNVTAPSASDSLYSLLTQIHYGGPLQHIPVNLAEVQSEDVSRDDIDTTTNEYPEVFNS